MAKRPILDLEPFPTSALRLQCVPNITLPATYHLQRGEDSDTDAWHGGEMNTPMIDSAVFPVNPRLLELHEELRHVVLSGIDSLSPSRWPSPEPISEFPSLAPTNFSRNIFDGPSLDLAAIPIPRLRLIRYLQNWVTECAPILDRFDTYRQFQIQVPIIARSSPSVLYAMLTFSSRQMERRGASQVKECCDSPDLYQESIRLLAPALQAKDPNVLVAACILAVFELMSWNMTDWRRHLEGCAALLGFFGVDGFCGGIAQAMFWCYAGMEVCGAIASTGTETAVLHVSKWVPTVPTVPSRSLMSSATTLASDDSEFVQALLHNYGRHWHPDMHSNWATYLCAKVCDLRFRRMRALELGQPDQQDTRPFSEQWHQLWKELRRWVQERPPAMLPVPNIMNQPPLPLLPSPVPQPHTKPFPTILFSHNAAISGSQLYHTACILMLEMRPSDIGHGADRDDSAHELSSIWHARQICGISCTNLHKGSRVNAIQLLYVAGRLFTHISERVEIARLLRTISNDTGWDTRGTLRDLEAEWGCDVPE